MRLRRANTSLLLGALVASLAEATPSTTLALGPTEAAAWYRAHDIFNAVHNAMRQWGSSLHHNGMSFFLARIPENVLLHHGNDSPDTPLGRPDWVAFEIEHAEQFARPRRRRPAADPAAGGYLHTYRTTKPMTFLYVDGMGAGKTAMGTLDLQDYVLRALENQSEHLHAEVHDHAPQHGHNGDDGLSELRRRGQVPARDGEEEPPRPSGPFDEVGRAADICSLCKEWGLQGAIRMEAGFEVIKCDFSDGFEQVQALQRPARSFPTPGQQPPGQDHPHAPFGSFGSLEYLRGISERYHGIGGGRVSIDYSSMVSAFFFPVDLSNPDPTRPDLPRLLNVTAPERKAIKTYLLDTIAKRHRKDSLLMPPSIDWQSISDMIVGRYGDRIRFMAEEIDDLELMREEIVFLMTLFIDYSSSQPTQQEPDMDAAIKRCTHFYIPDLAAISRSMHATEADRLIHVAFTRVTGDICKTLIHMHTVITAADSSIAADASFSQDDDVGQATTTAAATRQSRARKDALARTKSLARELVSTLNWAHFKQCRPGCGLSEVCIVPMWPMGTVDEYESPRCANQSDPGWAGGKRYWADPRPGPPTGTPVPDRQHGAERGGSHDDEGDIDGAHDQWSRELR
ncbi:uncharacterized protein B0I36DRAFT_309245 [Microdochium trichocladiopsis]|uniref:Uncharacterized protein n=1 Tax=Microdochium trichocladiopsis TaxID=1682393 RepID=A0A9P9BVN9_9PEZI|nr:uncharacterized protein B0I36DRAFT_309245 [Microdochium trichocladiopsis]KAH7039765.1 hypothetical protein B0I36DRAFT_309245 [Microdochium trichocladiopsis]